MATIGTGDREIQRQRLQDWMSRRLPHLRDLALEPFSFPTSAGFSAETAFIHASYTENGVAKKQDFVLRRQLEGEEYFLHASLELPANMMSSFHRLGDVPVPAVIGVEYDRSILDTPFLLMSRIPGRIVAQTPNYNREGWVAELPLERRGMVWRNAIETIAKIHKADWRKDFPFLARPQYGASPLDQYIGATEEWYRWATEGRPHPTSDAAMEWLLKNKPENAAENVVWGDATPANILFGEDLSVRAVIDWEIAAIGPGEIDLGWWVFFDDFYSSGVGVERLPGLPDRQATIDMYESFAGRKVNNLKYYEVLAALRMAVVIIRTVSRQAKRGTIRPDSQAGVHAPVQQMLARMLDLPVPEVGQDFFDLLAAINYK